MGSQESDMTERLTAHIVKGFMVVSEAEVNVFMGFPDSSVGKERAFNAGDPGLIPGSGRSAGEGIDYPLQYSWASETKVTM